MTGTEGEPWETEITRRLPTLRDYSQALQAPRLCFPDDPDLAAATVRRHAAMGPTADAGNFGGVFRLRSENQREEWAVKCFTRGMEKLAARYTHICAALSDINPAVDLWCVPPEFSPDGLLVEGHRWPFVKMRWIEAPSLIPWIEGHLTDRAAMERLAADFTDVVRRMEVIGVAHGDLQHGNILVSAGPRVRLIDYDGMYVGPLVDEYRGEAGHAHYRHPMATDLAGPWVDRFPAQVIVVSLLALAADPECWERLRRPGEERLLLSERDLKDPASSSAFRLLERSEDERVRAGIARLREALSRGPTQSPPLDPITLRAPHTLAWPGRRRIWTAPVVGDDEPSAFPPATTIRRPAAETPRAPGHRGDAERPKPEPWPLYTRTPPPPTPPTPPPTSLADRPAAESEPTRTAPFPRLPRPVPPPVPPQVPWPLAPPDPFAPAPPTSRKRGALLTFLAKLRPRRRRASRSRSSGG